jgi:small-conductance mechanosensitive channel/CRP-like cAMP-binding protein
MTFDTSEALPLLICATLLLVASMAIGRLRPHWPLSLQFTIRLAVFAALTILVQRLLGSPLAPHYSTIYSSRDVWEHGIEAGWWLLAARTGVTLVRLLVVLEHRPRETRIVSDLMAGGIYLATLLAIVNFVFSVPIAGLLATSGVIAIVLGLALQSTLADVFSGVAVGIERPYKVGDLIWLEDGIEGHVVQVTWRSTQIATFQGTIAIVPNSVMAKARIINRSRPDGTRGDTIDIALDAAALPEHCLATLLAAVRAAIVPLAFPAPSVSFIGLHGDGATYEVSYSVASSPLLDKARTEVLAQIHRHLRFAGIALSIAGASSRAVRIPTSEEVLEQSDLFGMLDAKGRQSLASHFEEARIEAGEALFHEGDRPKYLFLIASGVVEITRIGPSGPHLVYRMSPGESLGAIGVITETTYSATAKALTPAKVFRMDKAAITAAIVAAPQLAVGLEALAARGRAVLARDAAVDQSQHTEPPEELRFRLRRFLGLLAPRLSAAAPLDVGS